jgi:NAD-dependent DNA ligase
MGQKVAFELNQPKQYVKVLAALGIPGVGKATAVDIANAIPNFNDLKNISNVEIRGVGPLTKQKIEAWLEDNEDWVHMLPDWLSLEHEVQQVENPIRVCITGKLDRTRDELVKEISLFGVEAVSTVTKQCEVLIYGDTTSSKYKKAAAQGTLMIDYWKHKDAILSGAIWKTIERTA